MRIAILALQGAFIEHKHMLQQLGVETFEIRQLKDWQQPKDGLILPGGESTVQMRLLKELTALRPYPRGYTGWITNLRNLCWNDTSLEGPSWHNGY